MSIWRLGLGPWLKKKVVDPFLQIIGRGAEPKQLAFSTALGLTLGIFPICGVTLFLCGFAIALFGKHCHAPSILLANFVATPIELSLVIPFLRLGEVITGGSHFPLTSDAFKKVLTGQASRELLLSIVHALLGWIITAPIILAVLYSVFVPTFKYLIQKFSSMPSSPEKQSLIEPDSKLLKSRCSVCLEEYQADFLQIASTVSSPPNTTCPLCKVSLLPAIKSSSHSQDQVQLNCCYDI